MSDVTLTAQQDRAALAVSRWLLDPAKQVFLLFGYAGVGKSTLAKRLVDPARWKFCTLTGKAAHVLRKKGIAHAQTLHSLIYRPNGESKAHEISVLESRISGLRKLIAERESQLGIRAKLFGAVDAERMLAETKIDADKLATLVRMRKDLLADNKASFTLWAASPLADPDVDGVVLDEMSMLDKQLASDLESFGKKILAMGDPAQLPPVRGEGFYMNQEPDFLLTEVHRQAQESGILRLATDIRQNGCQALNLWIDSPSPDCQVLRRSDTPKQQIRALSLAANQIIAGRNATCREVNLKMRELRGYASTPAVMPGEKLMCLRNDRGVGLYNGSQWIVEAANCDPDSMIMDLDLVSDDVDPADRRRVSTSAWMHDVLGRGAEMDEMNSLERLNNMRVSYGDCLTAHKGQGSGWPSVLVHDESSMARGNSRSWLYTSVTRASEKLVVIT